MSNPTKIIFAIFLISLITACASNKIQYSKTDKPWQQVPLPDKSLEHQVFLIGETSGGKVGKTNHTLQLLSQAAKKAGENSSVVFLGDNIHPSGLPSEKHPDRAQAEQTIKAQLEVFKSYSGKITFIPGEKDWTATDGLKRIQRQEQFIQEYLTKKVRFLPNDGCSGPKVKEVSETTVMIVIDSQWYLENWDAKEGINENCEYRTRGAFLMEVMDKVKDYRHKNIILAMHHPLNSNGPYGGHYPLKQHLLPLPVLGTATTFLNSSIANRQELRHPNYQELKLKLIDIADKYTNVIFVAGHEHSLQYFEEEDQHFIVSGAGSQQSPVALGGDADFVAGVKGYSALKIFKDGEVWVEYWATSNKKGVNLPTSELIFRKKVRPPLPSEKELIPASFPEYERLKNQGSITASIMEPEDLKIHNQAFWGHLYTQDYLTDFKIPVFDLSIENGGLTAIGKGGGNQTNSIRLKNKEGKYYQLRSIEKVTERFPGIVRKTFANDLARQELTAGNPFSAVVVGPMASSIGVFHTNPKIVYVPKQPNLGIYNELGGEVYLFEERGSGDWSDLASFGNAEWIENMGNVIEGRLENSNTIIDQAQVLRSRLFDMIIGDWDRHQDQWRWAGYKQEDGKTLYKPIPRDRDQAYAKFDGIANFIANYTVPFTRAADKFNGEISKRETTWLNYQARHFDRLFLTKMTLADWEREAKFIQMNLSNEVIEEALKRLPSFAYNREGEKLTEWTKMRRNDLLKTARDYYKILNKEVNVFGTHEANLFVIKRINDLQVKVSVFETHKVNAQAVLLFERTFETEVTKELRLYGLDGNDRFEVTGTVDKSILLRLIGGHGDDIYMDKSEVKGIKKKTKIYDDLKNEGSISSSKETKDNRSNRKVENTFDALDYEYNYMIPIPIIGRNPDDGLFVSLNMNWNTFTFKRKQLHKISGSYSIGTGAFSFGYEADYFKMLNNWDTYLKVVAEVPRSVSNFHGLGNETERNIDDFGRNFYRVRRQLLGLYPAFKRRTDAGTTFSIGPTLEAIKIEDMDDRITDANMGNLPAAVFQQQYFGGGNMSFNFYNADHGALPTQGLGFTIGTEWRANFEDFDRQLIKFKSDLAVYNQLGGNDIFVLSNRLGGQHIIGEYDFFQAANLGGRDNLRGFANERFSGRTAFYHNIDLRIKIFDSNNNTVPISGGITPGFDYGRVWIDDDVSDKWHTAYGGTIWIAPLDYIALSAGMFFSENENRLVVRAGFQF